MLSILEESGKTVPALSKKPKYDPFIHSYIGAFERLSSSSIETNTISITDTIIMIQKTLEHMFHGVYRLESKYNLNDRYSYPDTKAAGTKV